MTILFYAIAALALLLLLLFAFMRADAARLASAAHRAGPVAVAAAGVGLMLIGRAGLAGLAFTASAAWYAAARRRQPVTRAARKHSTVRTAAIEMELDHDTGSLEGIVLAGRFEGRVLGQMSREDLLELRVALAGDGESLQLLEAYLDGRVPGWRDGADANAGGGEGVAPGSGAMTQKEAYQILGLEAGASAADIRKAHRRLMQRLHPDLGGSTFLAARINAAKDVLLDGHD